MRLTVLMAVVASLLSSGPDTPTEALAASTRGARTAGAARSGRAASA